MAAFGQSGKQVDLLDLGFDSVEVSARLGKWGQGNSGDDIKHSRAGSQPNPFHHGDEQTRASTAVCRCSGVLLHTTCEPCEGGSMRGKCKSKLVRVGLNE